MRHLLFQVLLALNKSKPHERVHALFFIALRLIYATFWPVVRFPCAFIHAHNFHDLGVWCSEKLWICILFWISLQLVVLVVLWFLRHADLFVCFMRTRGAPNLSQRPCCASWHQRSSSCTTSWRSDVLSVRWILVLEYLCFEIELNHNFFKVCFYNFVLKS